MAIQGRIPVEFGQVFPHGAFAVAAADKVENYETKRQDIDPVSGLPVWAVDVYDADPDAKHKASAIRVKVAASVCPVLPEPVMGPFRPVEFDGLTITPWVEVLGKRDNGDPITRVAYSYRATGVRAPGGAAMPTSVKSTRPASTGGATGKDAA